MQAKQAAASAAIQGTSTDGTSQAALRQEQHRKLRQQQGAHLRQQQALQQALVPAGRPQRQAALLAANRTAAFARTGMFPEEDGELPLLQDAHPDAALHVGEAVDGLHLPCSDTSMDAPVNVTDALFLKVKQQQQQHGRGSVLAIDAAGAGNSALPAPMVTAHTFTAASSLVAMAHQSDAAPSASAGAGAEVKPQVGSEAHVGRQRGERTPCTAALWQPSPLSCRPSVYALAYALPCLPAACATGTASPWHAGHGASRKRATHILTHAANVAASMCRQRAARRGDAGCAVLP